MFEQLSAADREDQRVAMRVLAVAAILDGKTTGDERRLLREASATTGLALSRGPLGKLRRRFASGRPLTRDLLEALAR